MSYALHLGDCIDVMRTLEPNSVDAVVTDPPYGIAFMGKAWDHAVPGPEFFVEMLRVAKPGAHLFAFGGTRLYHRMTCAIEDAGWEVRDCLSWLYGSGFPKSLAIDKAIDKSNGAERPVVGMSAHKPGIANGTRGHTTVGGTFAQHVPITSAASAASAAFAGYGTALKPAWEPIVLAMKPLDGTFAANAERWGVAGLHIDGGRIGVDGGTRGTGYAVTGLLGIGGRCEIGALNAGRWPANLALDEAAAAMLDAQAETEKPSRFFYTSKAGRDDRDMGGGEKSTHPTVKGTDLMRWLVRLAKPPSGGVILDPFMGSGSTGVACVMEGARFIGIEREPEYLRIAEARIKRATRCEPETTVAPDGTRVTQLALFGDAAP
jgi:hypothetical protein